MNDGRFVTFTRAAKNVDWDGKLRDFEKGDTVKLPQDFGLDEGAPATRYAWECVRCKEIFERREKPIICGNPSCGRKTFRALHPITHSEIGEVLLNTHEFKTTNDTEELYVYQDGIYNNKTSETLVREETGRLNPDCKTHLENEVLEYIKTSTYIPRGGLGLPRNLIAVKSGIPNLNDVQLEEFTPEPTPICRIPVKHGPDAECPQIMDFLKDVPHHDDIPIIREEIGHCLLKDYPISTAFMLIGSGANGKSTLLNLITHFLGGGKRRHAVPLRFTPQPVCEGEIVRKVGEYPC